MYSQIKDLESLKSTEEFGVQVQEKAKKRDIAEKRAAETKDYDAKQRAEAAAKTAAQVKKREQSQKKAEDKAAAKAVAVKKADEEKAYASSKVDKAKKKAAYAADAAKQAAGVERKKAEDRFNAELRPASAAPERQRKSTFCGRLRRPKVKPKIVESCYGFVLSDDKFCVKLKTVAISQSEFQKDEKIRQSHPIVDEVTRQLYRAVI